MPNVLSFPGAGGVVSRPGLFGRLGASARVTVVSAPPGSGKTILLRSWVGQPGLAESAAWVPVGRYADSQVPGTPTVGKVGVAPLPTFAGQPYPGYSNIGGWNLYINPHSKNVAADLTFIKFMASTTAQNVLAVQYSEIPTVQSVRTSPQVLAENPVLATVPKTRLVPRPAGTPNYPQLSTAIYQNVNSALAGSTSPTSAMGSAQSAAQTALSSSAGGL